MKLFATLGKTWIAVLTLVVVGAGVCVGFAVAGSSSPSIQSPTATPGGGSASTGGADPSGLAFTGGANPSGGGSTTTSTQAGGASAIQTLGGEVSTAQVALLSSGASTFTISGTIYKAASGAYPATSCSGTPELLYPGVALCEVFTVTNSMSVPISVQSISTTLTSTGLPAVCVGSNLTLPSWTASAASPAFTVNSTKMATSPGVLIELNDSHTNQNACKNITYQFSISGTATYTDTTSTVVTSSTDPSTYGSSVTFTATVSGGNPHTDSYVPAGTVSFYSCPSATSCAASPSSLLGTGTLSAGKATFATSSLPLGSDYVEAVYPGSSTDYSSSTSGILAQTVGYTRVISGNQNGSLIVGAGQAVEIISSGKVNGSATVQSGGILYLDGGTVNGGVTVQSGGTFNALGGSVNGSVSVSGAKTVSLCSVAVNGGVSVANSMGPVVIGNPTSCGANTISGALTVTGNIGGVTVSGNTVKGGVTINNNTGPSGTPLQTVSANTITGGLACSANTNLTDASKKNTVTGSRSGQCTGSF